MAFPDTDLDVIIEAFLGADPTAAPGTWPAATDLASRLLAEPIRITRGRQQGQSVAASGSCTFTLDNDDGALTPLYAPSPYFPGWDLGVPVRVSVDNVGASPPYPRFCGFAASIEPAIVPVTGRGPTSAVRVTLGGVLRRMSQGSVARSALWRSHVSLRDPIGPVVAYWPMEAGSSATVFGAELPGGGPLTITAGLGFGQDSELPGSATLPVITADTILFATVSGSFPDDRWTSRYFCRFDGAPSSRKTLMEVRVTGGSSDRWVLDADSTTMYLTGYLGSAVVDSATSTSFHTGGLFDGDWCSLSISTDTGAASFNAAAFRANSADVLGFVGNATSVVAGSPISIGRPASVDMAIGHWSVVSAASANPATGPSSPAMGSPGEEAHVRIANVLDAEGIPNVFPISSSVLVGPQPTADVVSIIQDAEAVDHGVLAEDITTWGLTYRTSAQRFNLDPALTVDLDTYRVSGGESVAVVVPRRDDQRTRNEWTITRPDGATSTFKDEAHQAKRGRFDDEATVNVYTDYDTLAEASIRVLFGTVERLRYAGMPLDLAANNGGDDGSADLLSDWLELELGDRMDGTNHPTPPHPHDDVPFTFEGYSETIQGRRWLATAVVEPYDPWRVQQMADTPPADDDLDGWLIPDSMTVDADFDAGTDTSLDVDVTPAITTSADEMPLRIRAAGVLLEVTAVGAPSGTVQTLTVTQTPLNGVEKTITAGTVAEVADPLVLSL